MIDLEETSKIPKISRNTSETLGFTSSPMKDFTQAKALKRNAIAGIYSDSPLNFPNEEPKFAAEDIISEEDVDSNITEFLAN